METAKIKKLGPEGILRELADRVDIPDHPRSTPMQREALANGLEIVDDAISVLGDNERLFMLKSMMLGKLGRFDDAVANARAMHARGESWQTAVTLGNALRRAGDLEGAIASFKNAAALDPTDVAALLDAGDTLLSIEKWSDAVDAYGEALAREPDHAWAAPSAAFARYRATGDAKALASLQAMATEAFDECGVQGALAQLMGTHSNDDKIERARELLAELPDDAVMTPPPAKRAAVTVSVKSKPKAPAKKPAKAPVKKAAKPATKKPVAKKAAAKKPAAKKPTKRR